MNITERHVVRLGLVLCCSFFLTAALYAQRPMPRGMVPEMQMDPGMNMPGAREKARKPKIQIPPRTVWKEYYQDVDTRISKERVETIWQIIENAVAEGKDPSDPQGKDDIMKAVDAKVKLDPEKSGASIAGESVTVLKEKAQKSTRKKYPVSLKEKRAQLIEEAKKKYPILKVGDKITIKYVMGQREYSVTGTLYGFNKIKVQVNNRSIPVIDITEESRAQLDPKMNQELRDEYVAKQYNAYRNEVTVYAQKIIHRLASEQFKKNQEAGFLFDPDTESWIIPQVVVEKELERQCVIQEIERQKAEEKARQQRLREKAAREREARNPEYMDDYGSPEDGDLRDEGADPSYDDRYQTPRRSGTRNQRPAEDAYEEDMGSGEMPRVNSNRTKRRPRPANPNSASRRISSEDARYNAEHQADEEFEADALEDDDYEQRAQTPEEEAGTSSRRGTRLSSRNLAEITADRAQYEKVMAKVKAQKEQIMPNFSGLDASQGYKNALWGFSRTEVRFALSREREFRPRRDRKSKEVLQGISGYINRDELLLGLKPRHSLALYYYNDKLYKTEERFESMKQEEFLKYKNKLQDDFGFSDEERANDNGETSLLEPIISGSKVAQEYTEDEKELYSKKGNVPRELREDKEWSEKTGDYKETHPFRLTWTGKISRAVLQFQFAAGTESLDDFGMERKSSGNMFYDVVFIKESIPDSPNLQDLAEKFKEEQKAKEAEEKEAAKDAEAADGKDAAKDTAKDVKAADGKEAAKDAKDVKEKEPAKSEAKPVEKTEAKPAAAKTK